ncbi:uncharacterized protein BKA55DRAFT_550816 [Fusarium redolens]|jgi:hypothetical protein|uniref:2EXR domain-containing protein n=1 Tax=Fusarium redolens TaxID=48865 RepID=A0A9P9KX22_FUSRE|nr:uncharacterized protein BKA55DRAFT_550816 [Fusarium redolens]KAH7270178.1 hypothetical protein BKA55DRAFT_550816 [Fusarium redolens]
MQPTTSTSTSFPLFIKLPRELRCEIWKQSIKNEARVFYPKFYDDDHDLQQVNFPHKLPSIRQVCCEAYQASQTCGIFIFGRLKTIRKAPWFGIFSDIIHDPDDPDDLDYDFERHFNPNDAYDYQRVMRVARKIAVDWRRGMIVRNLLARVARSYHHCQTLFLVFGRYNEPSGDVTFFTIPDNEILEWGIKKEHETWGEMKEETMSAWRDEGLLNELGITEATLPKI